MKLFTRNRIALLLTLIYTLIIMSPLVPITMRSAVFAHAVTGECVGDCAICGCSPEQSANRTCCCWKKKQQESHEHETEQVADCCNNKKSGSIPVLSCGCPCGGNKPLALSGGDKFEQMPFRFSVIAVNLLECNLYVLHHDRLADLHDDPPDPPPKLIICT